jgi:hypothetical protein
VAIEQVKRSESQDQDRARRRPASRDSRKLLQPANARKRRPIGTIAAMKG